MVANFDADGKPTLYRELVQAAYATADRQSVDVETTPEWRAAQIIGNLDSLGDAWADAAITGTGFVRMTRVAPDQIIVKKKNT